VVERQSKRAQFVPSMRAYSAHNRLHVNAPEPCRFVQSYTIGSKSFRVSPTRHTAATFERTARRVAQQRIAQGSSHRAMRDFNTAACDFSGESDADGFDLG
jgi:hypothetical protein